MKRVLGGIVVLSFVTLLVGACDDSGDGSSWGSAPGVGGGTACIAYASCGSCTAVVGCGWCEDPNGNGLCAPQPDACPSSSFSWSWDPSGCRMPADASVGAVDASPAPDAGKADAPTDAANDASSDASGDAVATSDAPADGARTDAAADGATDDASSSDASDAADAVSSGDGCASNAGTLCMAAAPFGMTCTTTHPFEASIPTPDPSLGCTIQPVPTLPGTAYFCCVSAP